MSPGFPASLFELLGGILDAEVEFDMTLSGPAPGDDPFADGTADLGWICSTSYVDLATRSDNPSIELAGVACGVHRSCETYLSRHLPFHLTCHLPSAGKSLGGAGGISSFTSHSSPASRAEPKLGLQQFNSKFHQRNV